MTSCQKNAFLIKFTLFQVQTLVKTERFNEPDSERQDINGIFSLRLLL